MFGSSLNLVEFEKVNKAQRWPKELVVTSLGGREFTKMKRLGTMRSSRLATQIGIAAALFVPPVLLYP